MQQSRVCPDIFMASQAACSWDLLAFELKTVLEFCFTTWHRKRQDVSELIKSPSLNCRPPTKEEDAIQTHGRNKQLSCWQSVGRESESGAIEVFVTFQFQHKNNRQWEAVATGAWSRGALSELRDAAVRLSGGAQALLLLAGNGGDTTWSDTWRVRVD
ncbi:hypothetical protein GUJ93_ZPchr0013g35692 [Zizania palustris]|uniref:Uncharacterized protein n=1 Tax=Zizania palustris TaxID=103762 RepID=A0A8J5WXA6_ZIZPA|nr:hypothetical protein GUJ93_ZPchr0013g37392 [Zizania palustris]KAG8097184.1 hypothetical protein GUJ93_ZPchr0013g35692 [Zizania palustris]